MFNTSYTLLKMSLYNTVPFAMIYIIKFKSMKYIETWCMALHNVIWYKCYLKLLERRKCTTNVPSSKWKVCSHWSLPECRQSPLLHTKGRPIQTSKGGKNSTAGWMWTQVNTDSNSPGTNYKGTKVWNDLERHKRREEWTDSWAGWPPMYCLKQANPEWKPTADIHPVTTSRNQVVLRGWPQTLWSLLFIIGPHHLSCFPL